MTATCSDPGPLAPARPDGDDEDTLYRRVAFRLMPLIVTCYVVSNLDRINVSFAKLQMMSDLGFSDAVYGLGAGLFFIGYAAVEVPSNLLLHRFGARIWITRILVTWGAISAAMSVVTSLWSFYVLRFALGVAEAGLFPGIIYYLTQWYPRHRRARITSMLYIAVPIAGFSGSLLSGLIISKFDQFLSLAGWQWMFILEALPAILLAPVVFATLPDRIATARWLSPGEKLCLARILADDREAADSMPVLRVFATPHVWHLGAILFTIVLSMYGVFFFLPTIIRAAGLSTPLEVALASAIPYAASVVMMLVVSRSSDRTGERRWHIVGSTAVGAMGIVASVVWKDELPIVLLGMCLAVGGIMAVLPVFWGLATGAFKGASEAAAIAFINSLALTGGFVGPFVVGAVSEWTGSVDHGMLVLAIAWRLGAFLVLAYRVRMDEFRLVGPATAASDPDPDRTCVPARPRRRAGRVANHIK